jgi:hypothetical protein
LCPAAGSSTRPRTRRLCAHFLEHGFAADAELAVFLDEFLGLNDLRDAACAGYVAPFQILSDLIQLDGVGLHRASARRHLAAG